MFLMLIVIGLFSHQLYEKNGVQHMRMKFYIQGLRKQGTVNLEVKEVSTYSFDY